MATPISAPDIYDLQLNAGKAAKASRDATDPLDINSAMGAIEGTFYVPISATAGRTYTWQPKYDISLKDAFVRALGTPVGGAETVEIVKLAADGTTETSLVTITIPAVIHGVTRITAWSVGDLDILALSVGESLLVRSATGVTGGCELSLKFANKQ